MEWDITKLAIVVLSVMVFAILMTFYGQFSELLKLDKKMQERKDELMHDELMKCVPSMLIMTVNEKWSVKTV